METSALAQGRLLGDGVFLSSQTVRSIGNDLANDYYEYRLPKDYKKATRGDDPM